MHPSSMKLMKSLFDNYSLLGNVYDIGSQSFGGGIYKQFIDSLLYTGCDIENGRNVDLIISEFGPWKFTAPNIISGQCLEHVRYPWMWIHNVAECLEPNGICIIIAPRFWEDHHFPIDVHRFLPDGMRMYLEWAGLGVLEVGTHGADSFGVGKWTRRVDELRLSRSLLRRMCYESANFLSGND